MSSNKLSKTLASLMLASLLLASALSAAPAAADAGPCKSVVCHWGARCEVRGGEGVCVCADACIDIYQPVCGSDQHSYTNLCWLNIAMCREQKLIKPLHEGLCCAGPQDCWP